MEAQLRQQGMSVQAMLVDCGVLLTSGVAPAQVDSISLERFLERMLDISGGEVWHLDLARRLQPFAFRELGMAAMTSGTVRDAMDVLVRFSGTFAPDTRFTFSEFDTHSELELLIPGMGAGVRGLIVDMVFASMVNICRQITLRGLSPRAIEMTRPQPADTDLFQAFFDCPITFGAPRNVIFSNRQDLDVPIQFHDPEMLAAGERLLASRLDALCGGARGEVQRILAQAFANEVAMDSRGVASMIGTGVRNLQRKLAREGTSFQQILDDVRRRLALQWLKDSQNSIGEVSDLLGFNNRSGFNQAFRRWTGTSPREWRNRQV